LNQKAKQNNQPKTMTAVRWAWFDDKKWIEYDAAVNGALEAAFGNGEKKIAVDKERFVDVNFASNAEIQKCLKNADPALIGVQRRFDDESRRRAVRRVVPSLFDTHVFLLLLDAPAQATRVADTTTLYGGLVSKTWKKAVTAVLATPTSLAAPPHQDALRKASAAGVPIVDCAILDDVVAGASWAAALPKRDMSAAFAGLSAPVAVPMSAPTAPLKRKAAAASAAADEPAAAAAAASTSSATASTSVAAKKAKTVSLGAGGSDLRTLIQVSTSFEGLVRYADTDEYEFELVIDTANAATGTYKGTAEWKKLKDAKTEWDITMTASGGFSARESKAKNASAVSFVTLGATYAGVMSDKGDLLMGAVTDPDAGALAPTFRLTHKANLGKPTAVAAADDADDAPTTVLASSKSSSKSSSKGSVVAAAAAPAKTFAGVMTIKVPFELTVEGDGSAQLQWAHPASGSGSNACAAELGTKVFKLRKTSKARGSIHVILPTEWDGEVDGDKVTGDVDGATFEMKETTK
jgi:hypothetical protein